MSTTLTQAPASRRTSAMSVNRSRSSSPVRSAVEWQFRQNCPISGRTSRLYRSPRDSKDSVCWSEAKSGALDTAAAR